MPIYPRSNRSEEQIVNIHGDASDAARCTNQGDIMRKFEPSALPDDSGSATLAGRVKIGPRSIPILVRNGCVIDVSGSAATTSDLFDLAEPHNADGSTLCHVEDLTVGGGTFELLSPIDLQCIKACGVTFAVSAIERVIEERTRGESERAQAIRDLLGQRIEGDIRAVTPGSADAAKLKAALIEADMWSQYLEVAIGPDAEIFTKAPVLSSCGWGREIGIRSDSAWNNPEPEVVLVIDAQGRPVGATLGNDVNLRDFEGRSALLLGKAKDNNASCALGPFVRLFDEGFTMDDIRNAELQLTVDGPEGFHMEAGSSMNQISRDPNELLRQALSEHQYPDGFVLFLGSLFAPTQDRTEPGGGFTHMIGDRVTISSSRLGSLTNHVVTSRDAAPWTEGIRALFCSMSASAQAV
ncbi:fumarylacetoacetate hydrolase family protein [Novosphingobium sp. ERW19]|uniref:fumarylacetoacetate hydrolase family protein n=1 Tax=Novosphingobium sp. ERW19 TaxID=2726186 RepID=UPI001F116126|nr:fumarylacetoacetate hydrolase family protein [Novosphingobium sp. ERW19]